MKKTILRRFIFILAISMLVSGFFFFITVSKAIRNNTKDDLELALHMLDGSIEYDHPLQKQIMALPSDVTDEEYRITIIDKYGVVQADSSVKDFENMENHGTREEIVDAIEKGFGYAIRQSETKKIKMLYVAIASEKEPDYILRMAIPYSGTLEYIGLLLPAIIVSIGIATIVAVIMAETTTGAIVKPLNQIAKVMERFKDETKELEFEEYKFDELNVIAQTTKRMSNSMRKYVKDLEFEKIVRQEFFTNVSHELKTPITSIRGYTELLLNNFAVDEEMKSEFMSRILKETEHMNNLINDILMISRLETKDTEELKSEIRLAILLDDVLATFRPSMELNELSVHVDCIPCTILANSNQIKELFSNLISNAIKYNKKGGSIDIKVSAEHKNLHIAICDTGIGIPVDEKNRVFERFYRVDRARSKKISGTGLGLSIVKHIVGYYQGTISLESKVNEGSTFTIRIPNIILR